MLNVLIVEDDLSIADLVQESLEMAGFGVVGIISTVEDAIDAAERLRPDFAIIDLHLAGGGQGNAVAAHLRKSTKIGILISTADYQDDLTSVCGHALMTKPYRLADLPRALNIIAQVAKCGHTDLVAPRSFKMLAFPVQPGPRKDRSVAPAIAKGRPTPNDRGLNDRGQYGSGREAKSGR